MVFASGPVNGCRGDRSQGTGVGQCDSLPTGLDPVALADRLGGNGNRLAIEQAAEAEIGEALIALSEIGTYSP
jgi:hypothetical protein